MITTEMVAKALIEASHALMDLPIESSVLRTNRDAEEYKRRVVAESLTKQLLAIDNQRVEYRVVTTEHGIWAGVYSTEKRARAMAMAKDAQYFLGDGSVRVSHVEKVTSVLLTQTERIEVPLYVG